MGIYSVIGMVYAAIGKMPVAVFEVKAETVIEKPGKAASLYFMQRFIAKIVNLCDSGLHGVQKACQAQCMLPFHSNRYLRNLFRDCPIGSQHNLIH